MHDFSRQFQIIAGLVLSCALFNNAQDKNAKTSSDVNRLGPDDQIAVHVSDAPDISDKPLRIDSEGFVKIPMVGRVHAAGMTPAELETELTKQLKVYLEEPEVVVSVAELHSQPVSVIGAVANPGIQQLQGHKTLVEVISMAGGLRPDAAPVAKITRLKKWGPIPVAGAKDDPSGQFSIAEVDLKSLINANSPKQNIAIFPNDIVSVPRAEMVFVLGDVEKAGALPLSDADTMSVLEAISTSGGTLHTASITKAKILRVVTGSNRRAELPVNIKNIQDGKAEDVQLVAGDILYVPSSNGKRMSMRALEAAVTMGTMAGSYGMVR
jgi:polysaccharide export outer membrane protein